jgi:hypothetical protein
MLFYSNYIEDIAFDYCLTHKRVFFITPESIVAQSFRMEKIAQNTTIAALVVDECHW